MSNSNSLLLSRTLHSARQLTKFYLTHAKELDVQKQFDIGTFKTNSIHWIVAHLTWAEDFLILRGIGNKGLNVSWFEKFSFGAKYPEKQVFPDYKETVETFDKVHKMSLKVINDLTEAGLQQPNHIGIEFGNSNSKEVIIQHCIRHEAMHCGHLSWILRMHGVKKII